MFIRNAFRNEISKRMVNRSSKGLHHDCFASNRIEYIYVLCNMLCNLLCNILHRDYGL